MEGSYRRWLRTGRTTAIAALALAIAAVAGCGGGEQSKDSRSQGVELAARLPSNDALNVAIANVAGIRETLGMPAGSIPPTRSDDDDLVFLDEIRPALGVVGGGEFPQPVVDAALERARWVAGVAGDEGVTAFSISGDSSDLESVLRAAGLTESDGEWVGEDKGFAIALGNGLVVFADEPGHARPAVEDDPGDPPEELEEIRGEGQLMTLSRFGANCIDAVATIDTPGEDGEIAFFTTATPDPAKITAEEIPAPSTRVAGDSARVSIPAAEDPSAEPPALRALQTFQIDYDCNA